MNTSTNDLTNDELLEKLQLAGVPLQGTESRGDLRNLMRKIVGAKHENVAEVNNSGHAHSVQQVANCSVSGSEKQQTEEQMQFERALLKKKQLEMEAEILQLQLDITDKKAKLASTHVVGGSRAEGTKLNLSVLEGMCYKFSGADDQNINAWLRDLESALALFSCDEAEKLIAARSMLSGGARRLIEIKGVYDYEVLKRCLIKEYGSKLSIAKVYRQLTERKIKANETVKQFVMEMENIATFGQVPEAELVDIILHSLRNNLEVAAVGLTITTLDELKEVVQRLENRGGGVQSVENRGGEVQQRRAVPAGQIEDASAVRCYNCFKYGHYQGQCQMPKRPPNSCFVCAEVGHTRHECPKKRGGRTAAAGAVLKIETDEVVGPSNNVSIFFCDNRGHCSEIILNALFDTGSPVSFIQETSVCSQMLTTEVKCSRFRGMGNSSFEVIGKFDCLVRFKDEKCQHSLFVIPDKQTIYPLIVGRDLMKKMNIILKKERKIKYNADELRKFNVNLNCLPIINKYNDLCKADVTVLAKQVSEKEKSDKHMPNELEVNQVGSLGHHVLSERVKEKIENCKDDDEFSKEEILGAEGNRRNLISSADVDECSEQYDIDSQLSNKERETVDLIIKQCYVPCKNGSKSFHEYAMKIRLTDDRPVYSSPRRLSFKQKQEVKIIIDDLLKQNIIRPSQSPYASPIVLTVRKNGKIRMCVDYRAVNLKIVRDNFPLPLIEDCLSYLSGKKYFSTLDLKNGFHQVPVHEESIPITAFVTPMGQYEYCYVPFGLANSPPVFQRYMSAVLKPIIDRGDIMVYLDDIIVATKTMSEQLRILKEVLQLLSEAGLVLNFEKCKFGYQELQYLGYRVNKWGVRPNLEHLKAISEYPVPTNTKEVQKAIGLFSYFRRFVPGFSSIAGPLHNLVRKDVVFEWTDECQKAFLLLKQKLTEAPVLSIFDPSRETELHTDASSRGYGAVLLQKQDDQKFHPVAYYSKTTTDAESRYHSFELETLAIVNALDRFRQFLDGISFTIVTDCNSLVLTLEKKFINPRIARWTLEFENFDFKVRHRKGDQMRHVDALSRLPMVGAVEDSVVDVNIQIVQSRDNTVVQLKQKLELEEVEGFVLENGLVFRVSKKGLQLYVPRALENNVMQMVHENYGHQGVDKCVKQIQKHYWFPSMRNKMNEFIKNCLKCIYYEGLPRENQRNLYNIEKKPIPFDTVHIDHFGPLEGVESKHRHILAVVDSFTKFVKLYAVNTGAKETICSLKKYFSSYSRPRRIVSDRGTCFTSAEFKKFCEDNNIIHVLNAVASPQSNGQVERVNRVIKSMLAKVTEPWSHSDWSTKLTDVEFAINNTVHTATQETPSKLLFGVEQKGRIVEELTEYLENIQIQQSTDLVDRRKNAEEQIKKAQQNNQRYFEKTHTDAKQFMVGDLVVIKNVDTTVGKNKKLIPKYKGPYVVRKQLDHDRYVVTDVENCQITQMPYNGVIDSSRMKKWLNVNNEQDLDVTEENTVEGAEYERLDESEDECTDYEFLNETDDESTDFE